MSLIINNTRTTGVILTKPGQNPVTVTATGSVDAPAYALLGLGTIAWTIDNFGALAATGTGSSGILLVGTGGGTVVNGDASNTLASISGSRFGIDIAAPGLVANFATISATAGAGVYLGTGGRVINGGPTSHSAYIYGYQYGIRVSNAAGTVTNLATIMAFSENYNSHGQTIVGVLLTSGGTVVNGSTNNSVASISAFLGSPGVDAPPASSGAAVAIGGAPGTVINYGIMFSGDSSYSTAIGVSLSAGGLIVNRGEIFGRSYVYHHTSSQFNLGVTSAIIANGPTTIANYGGIGDNVGLNAGGTINNTGRIGIVSFYAGRGGYVKNIGTGSYIREVNIARGGLGEITNAGRLGYDGLYGQYVGVDMSRVGTGIVVNGCAADRTAYIGGVTISCYIGASVTNFGSINYLGHSSQHLGSAISITSYGPATVNNRGSISSRSGIGVYISGQNGGTLVNSGTIGAIGFYAVRFGGGIERLIADPGGVFIGDVVGGTGPGAQDTLELASAASVGTIASIGTSFTNFTSVDVDKGARWLLAGTANSIASLSDDGRLSIGGGALTIASTATGKGSIVFAAADETLALDHPRHIAPKIAGFRATETIDLLNIAVGKLTFASGHLIATHSGSTVASLALVGSFATKNFHSGGDGHGGTDITFVGTANHHAPMYGSSVGAVSGHEPSLPLWVAHAQGYG